MKILFACGGTAGHINPALATANYIRSRYPDTQVLFIGSPKGMEARLVPEAGYDFAPVELKGIQRRLSWHNFCYNLSSMELLCTCWGKIRRILRQFQPDVVVGTGGYVSGPVLRQAARMGFRTVTHESNAYPGMTTRLIAKTADKVLLAVPEAAAHLECRREPIVTGSPVREEILFADRAAAREKLIRHNLRLVAHIVKKYYALPGDQEDLVSIGTIGLMKAVDTFDATRKARFSTYASRCIENEIRMQFRRERKSGQTVSLQEALETDGDSALTLADVIQDGFCMEDSCERQEDVRRLRQLLDTLPARERQILLLRYGLAGQPPLTQLETAGLLGISRSYVSRLETHALELLRQAWGKNG